MGLRSCGKIDLEAIMLLTAKWTLPFTKSSKICDTASSVDIFFRVELNTVWDRITVWAP